MKKLELGKLYGEPLTDEEQQAQFKKWTDEGKLGGKVQPAMPNPYITNPYMSTVAPVAIGTIMTVPGTLFPLGSIYINGISTQTSGQTISIPLTNNGTGNNTNTGNSVSIGWYYLP
jgi:hypothetical protein